ncbi:FixH family protein [Sulfurimonas sp. HSL-1716]|uniref:FixH family protein n=1 Tax=Hydrocurvibacter sulfurireducens TaxID=3131937 RepID=UPI0031F8A71B
MKKNSGMIWPIAIGLSILGVVGLGAWTIVETSKAPVEESDIYMTYYQDADANANKIINATIAFNKKYNIQYLGKRLDPNNSQIIYKITTKEGKNVDNAKVKVIITRPQTHQFDMTLNDPKVSDGTYSFETKLPGIGRWNIMAQIEVGDNKRFFNLKTDTRTDAKPTEY